MTNTTPVAPYRGAGRPEATALVERAMDLLAVELGIDPVDLRRMNLIRPDEFPFTTVTGVTYDTGDYEKPLDEALRLVAYDDLRAEQAARRARGDEVCLGIGVAMYVEIAAFGGREFAAVEIGRDARVTVTVGTTPAGRPRDRVRPARLHVPRGSVRGRHGRALRYPARRARGRDGGGRVPCRSEARPSTSGPKPSWRPVGGRRPRCSRWTRRTWNGSRAGSPSSVPDRSVDWSQVVVASDDGAIRAEGRFRQRGSTFPFGAHVAIVDVDTGTGDVRLLRHVAVDDCGRILNPVLVRGQQHGGIGQGIAQALFEEVRYDESGSPMTSTLATYQMPSAADLPAFEASNANTHRPEPWGRRGSASRRRSDRPRPCRTPWWTLSHLGVRHIRSPSPERVWRALRGEWTPRPREQGR